MIPKNHLNRTDLLVLFLITFKKERKSPAIRKSTYFKQGTNTFEQCAKTSVYAMLYREAKVARIMLNGFNIGYLL